MRNKGNGIRVCRPVHTGDSVEGDGFEGGLEMQNDGMTAGQVNSYLQGDVVGGWWLLVVGVVGL